MNQPPPRQPQPQTGLLPGPGAPVYYRAIGQGPPLVLLHGGPDFDHSYLLPEMDGLADALRLIYYDQRGRGKSTGGVRAEAVSLATEMEDLERLRAHFGLRRFALLGHSWGGLLALEYALRHPQRLSHLLVMNSVPVSRADFLRYQQARLDHDPGEIDQLRAMRASERFQSGELAADLEYYRFHFRNAARDPSVLERLLPRLRQNYNPASLRLARAVEDRLVAETLAVETYDLLPRLRQLAVPSLVLHSEHDTIPLEASAHIAQAIPGARLVLLENAGHFPFLERPADLRRVIVDFVQPQDASESEL